MDEEYSIIINNLKVLLDSKSNVIDQSHNLRELIKSIPKETGAVNLVFGTYYRKKELVIPNIDFKDIERIIAWKINEMFNANTSDISYAYQLDNGPYVNKLFIVFLKSSYLRRIITLLKQSNLSLGSISVDVGTKLIDFNSFPVKRLSLSLNKKFIIFTLLLVLTVVNSFYSYKSYIDSKEHVFSTDIIPVTQVMPVAKAQASSSSSEAYDRLSKYFSVAAKGQLHLKRAHYYIEPNRVEVKGWFVNSAAISNSIIIHRVVSKGNHYEFTGEINVK